MVGHPYHDTDWPDLFGPSTHNPNAWSPDPYAALDAERAAEEDAKDAAQIAADAEWEAANEMEKAA